MSKYGASITKYAWLPLLANHQVLRYHSLVKPDSCMKSKSLVSQDYSYGIAFMDKNVMAEILVLLNPQSLHFSSSLCTSIFGDS